MPESVTDRCTKAHEYVFLLSKRARYYYDAVAIKESFAGEPYEGNKVNGAILNGDRKDRGRKIGMTTDKRNRRSVWEVATQPFSEAHFATFPPALIEPCILAGTSAKGCCAKCGAPWVRETQRGEVPMTRRRANLSATQGRGHPEYQERARPSSLGAGRGGDVPGRTTTTLGWSPSCICHGHFEDRDAPPDWISDETGERKKIRVYVSDTESPIPVPCTVLDPFGGAGTTGLVADRLQRDAVLIELNPAYAAMADGRVHDDAPLFASA
jgi:hypothetical protein